MLRKLLLSAAMLAMFANSPFTAENNANINQREKGYATNNF